MSLLMTVLFSNGHPCPLDWPCWAWYMLAAAGGGAVGGFLAYQFFFRNTVKDLRAAINALTQTKRVG